MGEFFQLQDLAAIAPELALTVFGLALLLFDLIVHEKHKLGYVGLAGLFVAAILLFRLEGVNISAYGGQLAVDPFAGLLQVSVPDRWRSGDRYVDALPGCRAGATRGVLRPHPFCHDGHDVHGWRHGPRDVVHRPGDHGHRDLHSRRFPARQPAIERSCVEVFPAGRLFLRCSALRNVAALRHLGLDKPSGDCGRPDTQACERPHLFGRDDYCGCGALLQDCSRSVPSVDPRRL